MVAVYADEEGHYYFDYDSNNDDVWIANEKEMLNWNHLCCASLPRSD